MSPKILNLPIGKHHIHVEFPGFTTKDTTVVLSQPGEMLVVLNRRPKGFLKIQGEGNLYATMYVRNTLVQRSHVRWGGADYDAGTYEVKIVFDNASRPDTTFQVPVQSGCVTTLNYVTGAINIACSGGAP
jgi:LSD1 subclass zinc finger protein